jgi:hypothetical protein
MKWLKGISWNIDIMWNVKIIFFCRPSSMAGMTVEVEQIVPHLKNGDQYQQVKGSRIGGGKITFLLYGGRYRGGSTGINSFA